MTLLASHNVLRCPVRIPTHHSRPHPVPNVQQTLRHRHAAARPFSRQVRPACIHPSIVCRVSAPEAPTYLEHADEEPEEEYEEREEDEEEETDESDYLDDNYVYDLIDVETDEDDADEFTDPAEEEAYQAGAERLYNAIRDGDEETFDELFDKYEHLLLRANPRDALTGDLQGIMASDSEKEGGVMFESDSEDSDEEVLQNAFAVLLEKDGIRFQEEDISETDSDDELEKLSDEELRAKLAEIIADSSYDEEDDFTEMNDEADLYDDRVFDITPPGRGFGAEGRVSSQKQLAAAADSDTDEQGDLESDEFQKPKNLPAGSTGQTVMGTVVSVSRRAARIYTKSGDVAVCPVAETSVSPVRRAQDVLKVGDVREFVVMGKKLLQPAPDDPDDEFEPTGQEIYLSLRHNEETLAWKRLRQLYECEATCLAEVVSVNEGGLVIRCQGVEGFVPVSQVGTEFATPEEYQGKEIEVKFMELDSERQRLVMSARKVTNQAQFQAYSIGDVVQATVQRVMPYGAFLDLGRESGGMSGLLHISQISFDRVTNVNAILNEGDKIKVMVLSTDADRSRLSLSTKKLEPTPGDMLRDPQLVYAKADDMAKAFKQRLQEAEEAARREGIAYGGSSNFESFDAAAYDQGGYGGYNTSYDSQGYDTAGYYQGGYNDAGYSNAGYNDAGYNTAGYNDAGYNNAGYNDAGQGQSFDSQDYPDQQR